MIVYLLLAGILDPRKELDKLAKDQVGLRQLTGRRCLELYVWSDGHQMQLRQCALALTDFVCACMLSYAGQCVAP